MNEQSDTSWEEVDSVLEVIATTKTNDWREIAVRLDLVPSEFLEFLKEQDSPFKQEMRRLVGTYLSEVKTYVNDVIADGRPFLDADVQYHIYKDSPVLPRGTLDYSKK